MHPSHTPLVSQDQSVTHRGLSASCRQCHAAETTMAGPLACRMFGTPAAPAQGAEHLKGRTIKVQRWVSYAMQEGHHAVGIPLYDGRADVHQLAEAAVADLWDFWGFIP